MPDGNSGICRRTNNHRLTPYIEGCEEAGPIAKLAEEHFKEKGRPLKIAVDESDWRFNSVSPEKVAFIRKSASTVILTHTLW